MAFYAKQAQSLHRRSVADHAVEAQRRARELNGILGGHAGMVYAPPYDLNLIDAKRWGVQRAHRTIHVTRVRRPATAAAAVLSSAVSSPAAAAGVGAAGVCVAAAETRGAGGGAQRASARSSTPPRRARSAPGGARRRCRPNPGGVSERGGRDVGGGGGSGRCSGLRAGAPALASVTMRARKSHNSTKAKAARRREARRLGAQESLWEPSTQSTWLEETSLAQSDGGGCMGGMGSMGSSGVLDGGSWPQGGRRLAYRVPPPPDPRHAPFFVPTPARPRSALEEREQLERRARGIAREAQALRGALTTPTRKARVQLWASVSAAKQRALLLEARYAGVGDVGAGAGAPAASETRDG